ncbi:MAG: thioredoxin domain-containing protein [Candidatus Sungbacteria bacterium]|nr:thioredoxin domain-containing protein [Candidatus Sungbacteria bacterium]
MENTQPQNNIETRGGGVNPYLIPGAIIVAGALIGAAVLYTSSPRSAVPQGTAAVGASPNIVPADLAGSAPYLGNPDAPVTLIEFGDFQCPFCGRFFHTTEPQIIEQYVKTGKARFVYRDFAFLGPESEWAAMAAECANEQGKFWQYHDYLYNNQRGENEGAFSKENLKAFARAIGLSEAQFGSCLDSDKYLEAVRRDTDDGRSAGVNGTPATFVNGRLIQGAVPFAQFQKIIEEELNK